MVNVICDTFIFISGVNCTKLRLHFEEWNKRAQLQVNWWDDFECSSFQTIERCERRAKWLAWLNPLKSNGPIYTTYFNLLKHWKLSRVFVYVCDSYVLLMNSDCYLTQKWQNDLPNADLMFSVIYELISFEFCSSGFVHEEFTLKYIQVEVVVGFIDNAEKKSST
jgi:hypothetical protein